MIPAETFMLELRALAGRAPPVIEVKTPSDINSMTVLKAVGETDANHVSYRGAESAAESRVSWR